MKVAEKEAGLSSFLLSLFCVCPFAFPSFLRTVILCSALGLRGGGGGRWGGSLLCYVTVREPSCFLPPSRERDTIACLCNSCLFITSGFCWGCLAKSWSQSISPQAALSACVPTALQGEGAELLESGWSRDHQRTMGGKALGELHFTGGLCR